VYNDIEASARAGSRLLDAILAAGFDHRHICGGHGFCTSCRVEIVEGAENISPVSALERDRLGPRAGELRLACQVVIRGPVRVRVPAPISSGFSPFEDESEQ
jgi:ferredoxin